MLAVAVGVTALMDKQSSKSASDPASNNVGGDHGGNVGGDVGGGNDPTEVCLTPSCVKAAAFILQNIDPDIDPCTDFYNFTCGNWAMKNVVPAGTYLTKNMNW